MTRLVVVGSINMDLVTVTGRFPGPGETLLGERFLTAHGGKGANQAVAAARLGAQVAMVGALGRDDFGDELAHDLEAEGVDIEHVRRIDGSTSGTASITVADGENSIIVVPAANARVSPAQVRDAEALIRRADAVLVQLEIPLDAVAATLALGRRLDVPVILNPAPAQRLDRALLEQCAYLTPNQHELATVLGADDKDDFRDLMRRAPAPVVLTRGGEGAWYSDGENEPVHQRGFDATVVDTTGAGDTFNAALAVFLHEGLETAVRKACAAAALSIGALGARGGMPDRAALDALLARA